MHKVLEDTNLKLTSVITEITGKSGRTILNARLQGEQDPQVLAELARGRMREKREQLKEAVQGTLSEPHRFLLGSHLRQLDFLDGQLEELDQEIAKRLGLPNGPADPDPSAGQAANEQRAEIAATNDANQSPKSPSSVSEPPTRLSSAQVIGILDEMTGINVRIGEIVVAEVGSLVDRFPTEDHLVSWAGLCPRAKISAGKRLSNKTGKGNRWLRQALIEAACAAARSKGTYLGAVYQRLRKRMGHKKALVALAHRMLVIIYHLLKEQQSYRELGTEYAEEKAAEASKRWALRRLKQLGYQVTLQPTEVA
jgi:transposase